MHVRSRVFLGVLSLVAAFILAACGGQTPADKAPEAAAKPAAAPAVPQVDVKKHMDEHFAKAAEVQAAVVRGDVGAAKESARWIAEHQETAGLPAVGQASIEEMKKAAKAVSEATDIKSAAQGAGRMAVACGTCHAAAGSKPVLPKAAEPAGGSEVLAHMHAHQHGVAMMYQGLIGPSDEAWTEGAKALKSAPLKPAQLPKSKAAKDGAKAEAETHVLADNAAGATDPKARGAMYAEVVGSCASCHGLYGLVLGEGLPKK